MVRIHSPRPNFPMHYKRAPFRGRTGLAEHATVKVAAGGYDWLQPLQFRNFDEVPQLVGKFLADPLTDPPSGATPASQARPGPQAVLIWLAAPVRFNAPWRRRSNSYDALEACDLIGYSSFAYQSPRP